MGEPKQLLEVRGTPLLELAVSAACASQLDAIVVVLGARADEIAAAVDFGRARVVRNPDHEQGMSTSLRAGIASLGADVTRAVVILGDPTAPVIHARCRPSSAIWPRVNRSPAITRGSRMSTTVVSE